MEFTNHNWLLASTYQIHDPGPATAPASEESPRPKQPQATATKDLTKDAGTAVASATVDSAKPKQHHSSPKKRRHLSSPCVSPETVLEGLQDKDKGLVTDVKTESFDVKLGDKSNAGKLPKSSKIAVNNATVAEIESNTESAVPGVSAKVKIPQTTLVADDPVKVKKVVAIAKLKPILPKPASYDKYASEYIFTFYSPPLSSPF